jgi:hypothetical protein
MLVGEIKAPKGASQYTLNLLRRAKLSSDSSIYNIDRYLNSPAITWNNEDKANFEAN